MRPILPAALLTAALALPASAQSANGQTILVLDASGSMWGQIDGTAKIGIAQSVIGDLLATLPEDQALGLTAYGHRTRGDCSDIETLVAPGTGTRDAIAAAVNAIQPRGKTPMTDAVRAAAEALRYGEEKATVILVSDGIETCNPDPCAAARALEDTGVDFTAHVVGFDVADPEALSQMQCLAAETGGRFLTAANASELGTALSQVVAEPDPVPAAVTFRATAGAGGPQIDTPLIWSLDAGTTPIVSFERAATLDQPLAAGDYTVTVLRPDDEESARQDVTVGRADMTVTLVLPVPLPAASLDAPDTGVAGDTVPIGWDGPDGAGDYIAAALPEEDGYKTYTYTRDGTPLALRLPSEPGIYELRYIQAEDRAVLARALITVTDPAASLVAADSAVAGATLPVTWEGPNYPGDYIAVGFPGDPAYVNYTYTSDGSPAQLLLPPEPGTFEIRYVMAQDARMLASRPLTVTAATATIDAPPQARAGETLMLDWTGPDHAGDYIAVSRPDDPRYETYTYTRNGSPLGLKIPLETGRYELRYFMGQKATQLAAYPIEVVSVGAALRAAGTARAGAPLAVDWDGPGYDGDYIAVSRPGDDGYEKYTYTREGSPLILQMPTTPGTYELRYLATGDGTVVLTRQDITLSEITATLTAADTASAGDPLAVDWDGPDYRGDFIAIADAGASDSDYLSYAYTTEDSPVIMDLPDRPGTFELRYHLGDGQAVIGRRTLEVTAD